MSAGTNICIHNFKDKYTEEYTEEVIVVDEIDSSICFYMYVFTIAHVELSSFELLLSAVLLLCVLLSSSSEVFMVASSKLRLLLMLCWLGSN